jgi:hypothetical protein
LRDFEVAFSLAKVGRKRQLWFMNDVNFHVWGFIFSFWFPPLLSFLCLVWFIFFFFDSGEQFHCRHPPPIPPLDGNPPTFGVLTHCTFYLVAPN